MPTPRCRCMCLLIHAEGDLCLDGTDRRCRRACTHQLQREFALADAAHAVVHASGPMILASGA